MFEYSKQILEKVSFDKLLFRKELAKALNWLKKEDALLLHAWCIATFGSMYGDVITDVFNTVVTKS